VGVSRERGNLKLHDAAASRISATVVDGEETALAVVDEPASASSRTNEPPRLLEGRELAAIRPTKRLVAPAGGSGTANDELSDINRVLGRVAGLVEQLHENRVAVEVGGGVLPLREGDRCKNTSVSRCKRSTCQSLPFVFKQTGGKLIVGDFEKLRRRRRRKDKERKKN